MHSEDVMLLDNSELQLMYWLLVDAYSASRVLEAIIVALRQKSVSIINAQSFWGEEGTNAYCRELGNTQHLLGSLQSWIQRTLCSENILPVNKQKR